MIRVWQKNLRSDIVECFKIVSSITYWKIKLERNQLVASGGKKEKIEELTDETNSIAYEYNCIMEFDNNMQTSSAPVHKLRK